MLDKIILSDGVNWNESRNLKRATDREILKKYGSKKEFLHKLLKRFYHNFDKYIKEGKIWNIYHKAEKSKTFAAILQIYLKIQGKYNGKIDGIVGKRTLKGIKEISKNVDEKEYKSILKLEMFKKAIRLGKLRTRKYKATYNNLLSWKEEGYKKIKMYYSGVRYDIVDVGEAIEIYEDMIKAGEISIKVTQAGVKYARNGHFNEEAASRQAAESYKKISHKEKLLLARFYAYARGFYNLTKNDPIIRKRFNTNQAWCANFVYKCAKDVKLPLGKVKNPNIAGSYFGLNEQGWHIAISDGKGGYIMGNTTIRKNGKKENGVAIRRNINRVGWILPKYAGRLDKVVWRNSGRKPPAGALVLAWARKGSLKYKANLLRQGKIKQALKAKLSSKKYPSTNRVYRNYSSYSRKIQKPRTRDPLKVLNSLLNN